MATCYMEYTRNDVNLDGVKEGWETREATQLSPEADLNDQVSKQVSKLFFLKWLTGQMLRMPNLVLQTSLSMAVVPNVGQFDF